MLNFILNFIFPPLCVICGKNNKDNLCKKCEIKLEKQKVKTQEKVLKVGTEEKIFDEFIYIFKYEEFIRKIILDYKFKDQAYLYKAFSKIILKDEKICRFLKTYDIIIPVSMSKEKKKTRGYNQTELIIKDLEKELNLNVAYNILIKNKNTKSQSTLNKKQRLENIKGAYLIQNSQKIRNKKVLIFDDIYTTRKHSSRNKQNIKISR